MIGGWGVQDQRVALTLYTDAYVARGTLRTRQRRLSDILNLADDDFLVLADATFERFGAGGVTRQAAFAQVNLGAVLFAVSDSDVEPVPELRTPKVSEPALISIPPFEIVGRIHLLPDRDLSSALQELTGRFIPVTDASFSSDAAGEPARSAQMLAVNHARAQILSPYGKSVAAPSADEADTAAVEREPGEATPERDEDAGG